MITKWQPGATAFIGGTAEALKLKGRRVKNQVPLYGCSLYDPIQHSDKKIDLQPNTIGVIANALMDEFLVAYPISPVSAEPTLEGLTRSGSFHVIRVNWPTFRMQFQIES